ncbi:hypothetical protein ACP8HZ_03885 [Francisella noatunensis]
MYVQMKFTKILVLLGSVFLGVILSSCQSVKDAYDYTYNYAYNGYKSYTNNSPSTTKSTSECSQDIVGSIIKNGYMNNYTLVVSVICL